MRPGPSDEEGQRRRLRIFVVVGVSTVLAIYAAAIVIGKGFAGTPFPPDLALRKPERREAEPAAGPGIAAATVAAEPSAVSASTAAVLERVRSLDRVAPWWFDAAGQLQWREGHGDAPPTGSRGR